MPETLADCVIRLENSLLPVLGGTRNQVRELLDRPSLTHARLQQLIGRDPGFTLAVYRQFSALDLGERAYSLAHAISLMGTGRLEQLTDEIPVVGNEQAHTALLACYSRAAHAAWYAAHWARALDHVHPDEMGHAALLYDCGEIMLRLDAPERMASVDERVAGGLNLSASVQAEFGFTPRRLGYALFERWRMPPLFSEVVKAGWCSRRRPMVVILACAIARSTQADWDSDESADLIDALAEHLLIGKERAREQLEKLAKQANEGLGDLALTVNNPQPPASPDAAASPSAKRSARDDSNKLTLASQSETRPTELTTAGKGAHDDTPDQSANTQLVADSPVAEARTASAEPPSRSTDTAGAAPGKSTGSSTPEPDPNLSNKTDHKATQSPAQVALSSALNALHTEDGFARVIFALLSRDRGVLNTRLVLGGNRSSGTDGFSINMNERNLFAALLARPQAIWMKHDNRDKYLAAIPADVRRVIDHEGFLARSLFVHGRPLGMVYAEVAPEQRLDADAFRRFTRRCDQLVAELEAAHGGAREQAA